MNKTFSIHNNTVDFCYSNGYLSVDVNKNGEFNQVSTDYLSTDDLLRISKFFLELAIQRQFNE